MIDADPDRFPPSLLFEWKAQAERKQRERYDLTEPGDTKLAGEHAALRKREFGAWSWVLALCGPIIATLVVSPYTIVTFAVLAGICGSLSLYFMHEERGLARHFRVLAAGATAAAIVASINQLKARSSIKHFAGGLAAVWALIFLGTLGINAATQPSDVPMEPEALAATEALTSDTTIDIQGSLPKPEPAPVTIPGEVLAGAPGLPRTVHMMESASDETDPMPSIYDIGDVNMDIVGDPGRPRRDYVGQFWAGRRVGSQAVYHIKNIELVALTGQHAVIGGLPPDAESDMEPAPIGIEDSTIDDRINIETNVHLYNTPRKSYQADAQAP